MNKLAITQKGWHLILSQFSRCVLRVHWKLDSGQRFIAIALSTTQGRRSSFDPFVAWKIGTERTENPKIY